MLRLPNGSLVPGDQEIVDLEPAANDILVYSSGWEIAENRSWEVKARVGTIEQAAGSNEVLIKTPEGYAKRSLPERTDWQPGDFAFFNEYPTIFQVVSRSEGSASHSDTTTDISNFRIDLDPERFQWDFFVGSPETRRAAKQIVSLYATSEGRERISNLKVDPVRGVLFAGPPGTGKTFLAQIMAAQSGATFYLVTTASLGGHLVGESEERLEAIYRDAAEQEMSMIFVDEIEVLTKDRSSTVEHGSRLVNVFLTNMDGVVSPDNVLTIGATNRITDIDRALRRPGRFDREVFFQLPNKQDRLEILQSRTPVLAESIDFESVSEKTEGWTAADLRSILQYAGELAVLDDRSKVFNDHFLLGFEKAATSRAARLETEK